MKLQLILTILVLFALCSQIATKALREPTILAEAGDCKTEESACDAFHKCCLGFECAKLQINGKKLGKQCRKKQYN